MKLLDFHAWSCATILFLVGCSGGGGGGTVTQTDSDVGADTDNQGTPPAPWTNVTFTTAVVDASSASNPKGDLGNLARASDGTLYYAYLALENSTTSDCQNLAIASGTTSVPGVRYDVMVAVQPAGAAAFGTPERLPVEQADPTTNFVGARLGLDAVMDASNNLLVATPGGGNGQFTCAAANLLLGKRTPSGTYTVTKVTNSSADWGPFCASATTTDLSCCPQVGACTQGTDSGYYPSIAFDSNGKYNIAYLDSHFVTDNDGKTHGDFELLTQGGVFSGIDMWSGYGYFTTLRYKGTVGLVVTAGGLTGDLELFTDSGGGKWTMVDNFSDGGITEGRPRLEIAPNGNIGIAYYQTEDAHGVATNDLYFCEYEASDTTLSTLLCDRPESPVLIAGQDVSFKYDSGSRPVLAYYYCGGGSCVHDGLRVAWRDDTGKWWRFNAHNVDNDRSGNSASVVLDPTTGEPTIVFQDLTTGAAMVAYGKF